METLVKKNDGDPVDIAFVMIPLIRALSFQYSSLEICKSVPSLFFFIFSFRAIL